VCILLERDFERLKYRTNLWEGTQANGEEVSQGLLVRREANSDTKVALMERIAFPVQVH
jgi:hypothetical protein